MAKLRYADALTLALREELDHDPNVIILGEEVGQYLGTLQITKGFLADYGPERIIDTPISEVGIIGLGIGAAMNGLRPVCEMMRMDFSPRGVMTPNSAAMSSTKQAMPRAAFLAGSRLRAARSSSIREPG